MQGWWRGQERLDGCRSITVGMTEQEVLRRMTTQHKRIDLSGPRAGKHKLVFEGGPSGSANPQVVVDSGTSLVESIFCGE